MDAKIHMEMFTIKPIYVTNRNTHKNTGKLTEVENKRKPI